ncbi:MAG: RHS domain-containing protein, partial [Aquimonas sp.]|nr:RHS domain-containing protein [Aquimonas sp.]
MCLGAPSHASNTPRPAQATARATPQHPAPQGNSTLLAFPNRSPARPERTVASIAAPTLFCWDGNRLLAEQKADTHQLYLYEPDSFVPLAIVRWKAANSESAADGDEAQAANKDAPRPSRTPSKDSARSNAQAAANAQDTDRATLLPPELLSLKERYPEQWAKLEAQRRKLARQLGQSPEPEVPTPPKPEVFHVHADHLGTPREITDTHGHLVWTANYAAWGKAITSNPPRRILTRQGNTVAEVIEEQA